MTKEKSITGWEVEAWLDDLTAFLYRLAQWGNQDGHEAECLGQGIPALRDHLASTGRIRGEWRPISEAPRDGSLIILTRKRINKRFTDNAGHFKGDLVCTGKWKNNTWMTYPGNNRSEPKSGFTHFMPLPAAPGGE